MVNSFMSVKYICNEVRVVCDMRFENRFEVRVMTGSINVGFNLLLCLNDTTVLNKVPQSSARSAETFY